MLRKLQNCVVSSTDIYVGSTYFYITSLFMQQNVIQCYTVFVHNTVYDVFTKWYTTNAAYVQSQE